MVLTKKTAKISALFSGIIDKCEYLTSEDILPSDQSRTIKQAKFTYSLLGKEFGKQVKTTEEQGKTSWSIKCFKTYYPKIND